jgi:hypothetical protein
MSALEVILYWQTVPGARSLICRPFKGVLQQFAGLNDRSVSVIAGLNCQLVFPDSPFALAGNVEDLPDLDVTPDFGPCRIPVSTQCIPEGVHTGLVFALLAKQITPAISYQRDVRRRCEFMQVRGHGV